MRRTLGVAIQTKNEAKRLKECLAAVAFADEVVIVDASSTDDTVAIARELGARVIVCEDIGLLPLKTKALSEVTSDWALVLDTDEILLPEAREEIKGILERDPAVDAFGLPRHNFFFGRVLRYGRGAPDHPIRLVRKGKGQYADQFPHEYIVANGPTETLAHGAIHYSTPSINSRLRKIISETDNELPAAPAGPPGWFQIFINPLRFFLSYLIKGRTWRDGVPGVIFLSLFAIQLYVMQIKFYELRSPRK